MQLLAQHIVVAVAEGVEQAHHLLGAAHDYPVVFQQIEVALAVEMHARVVGMKQQEFDGAFAVHRDRPVAQGMRANRHEHHCLQRGVQDRPAGRQRISRGAGRGGNDHAVGTLAVNELAVDEHFQLDQASRGALADHRVVEGAGLEEVLPLAADGHIEQEARFA